MDKKGDFGVVLLVAVLVLVAAAFLLILPKLYSPDFLTGHEIGGNGTNQTGNCSLSLTKINATFNFSLSEPRLSFTFTEQNGNVSVFDSQGTLFWSTNKVKNVTDLVVRALNCDNSKEIIILTKQGGFYVFDYSGNILYSENINLMLAFGSLPPRFSCYADKDCGGSDFDIRNYSLSQLSEKGWDENEWTKNSCGYPILKNVGGDQEFC
jgi:hypothetical protein